MTWASSASLVSGAPVDEPVDELAERMIPAALSLIDVVHAHDRDGILAGIMSVDLAEARACMVLLAALARPDVSVADLVAWTLDAPEPHPPIGAS